MNSGPVTRNVTLTVMVGATTCKVMRSFMVERNSTDGRKQANDFYTSNHAAPTETVPGKGIVIDDHLDWHDFPMTRLHADGQDFFRFHRQFIARFNSWRAEFGYPPVVPWYPGTPYPAGVDDQAFAVRSSSFSTDDNQLFRPFTIAGGDADPMVLVLVQRRLADFADANDLDQAFEGTYHGFVHCNVGTGITPPSGQTFDDPVFGTQPFGDMCNFSSPKDPIFYPWHGFVDLVYENLCVMKSLGCVGTPLASSTDVWMGDNAADIMANGTPPSPKPRYVSPDIWNRTSPVTCTPPDAGSGVLRDCGNSTQHENPIAGQTNFLYATLRNNRPEAHTAVYTEVAVYIANYSTGLAWPANFGGAPAGIPLDETRHFITIALPPGKTTAIGPLPWTPPDPTPSDHWCLYIRVLNVESPFSSAEGSDIDVNTANNNGIAWKNLKILSSAGKKIKWPFAGFNEAGQFIVRNVRPEREPIELTIRASRGVAKPGTVRLLLGNELWQEFVKSKATLTGFAAPGAFNPKLPYQPLRMTGSSASVSGLLLAPQQPFAAAVDTANQVLKPGEIVVEQLSGKKVDGGVVMQVR
jgi:hypothetical protein